MRKANSLYSERIVRVAGEELTGYAIYPQKQKYLAVIAPACVILAVLLCIPWKDESGLLHQIWWFALAALVALALTGIVIYRRREPRLVISETSIFDNSHTLAAGKILWEQINCVYFSQMNGLRFLCIQMKDPEAFLAEQDLLRQSLYTANERSTSASVLIDLESLSIEEEELRGVIEYVHHGIYCETPTVEVASESTDAE